MIIDKTTKEKDGDTTYVHHDWHIEKAIMTLFIWIIIMLLSVELFGAGISYLGKDEIVYQDCTQKCSTKHFLGLKVGLDNGAKKELHPYVIEFDRTECLSNCNTMYLILQK